MSTLWQNILEEAAQASSAEPTLASFYFASVLDHESLAAALAFNVALRLDNPTVPAAAIRELCQQAMAAEQYITEAIEADIIAYFERDPACDRYSNPLLYFKGYQAIQAQRVAHWLWHQGRCALALYLQSLCARVFDVDIHPAARIGQGVMLDHATGLVIGETARVGNNVSLLHDVVLGGSGCQSCQRHPKVEDGVLVAAGARLFGNITIGEGSKIAAGSVVLADVPAHSTAAGVPARVIGRPQVEQPALDMNQQFDS